MATAAQGPPQPGTFGTGTPVFKGARVPTEPAALMESLLPKAALVLLVLFKTLKPVPGLVPCARAKALPLREPSVSVPGLSISC